MNHPSQEQWMDFLYDELDAAGRAELSSHMAECEKCRDQVGNWSIAMNGLDSGKPQPVAASRLIVFPKALKWAAAACIGLGFFGLGRATAPTPDLAAVNREVGVAVRSQLGNELKAEIAALVEEKAKTIRGENATLFAAFQEKTAAQRENEREALAASLRVMEQKRADEVALLRKELETVAVNARQGFRWTQNQLSQLASFTPDARGN